MTATNLILATLVTVTAACMDPAADEIADVEVDVDLKADRSERRPIGTFFGIGHGEHHTVAADFSRLVLMTDRTFHWESVLAADLDGTFKFTRYGEKRYIRFTDPKTDALIARYQYIDLDDDTFELIDTARDREPGRALTNILTRADSAWCNEVAACAVQDLSQPRCAGAWTCDSHHACAYVCAPDSPGCSTNEECAAGEYCAFEDEFTCNRPELGRRGTCRDVPSICPDVDVPVCGCDGRTHRDACVASQEGVAVMHDGACAEG